MKTTVKVLCYKSKTLSNGEHPLMICVCKDKRRKYKSLGISILPCHWDFTKNKPNTCCPNRDEIQVLIQQRILEIKKAILIKNIDGKDFSAYSLLQHQRTTSSLHNNVNECFAAYIRLLQEEGRLRYAGMYEVSHTSFIKFAKHLDIPFGDIDAAWLKRYETWMLKQGLAINTIGTRIRHLRAVFNMAIQAKIIPNDCYPFNHYKVSKIAQRTPKRAISKEAVQKVLAYRGKTHMERLAIDVFTFSYFSAGINFVDIAHLTNANIVGNRLVYTRAKTKKQIILPLQQEASAIIAKYATENSIYLFPILSKLHKTEIQKNNRLHKVLAKINARLKRIGEELGLPVKLTTYVARHSFATVLKREGVSTSIISETLGHSSERITQIYLDSFENSQIDKAMAFLK